MNSFTFLHLGDIHLGYRQYKLLEREKDFYRSFQSACQIGASREKVDFVLICGDLFNSRTVSPQTYNEAVFVLKELKEANVPVIAIEGNHDFKEIGNFSSLRGSWFEALAQNQLLHFLYPEYKDDLPLLKSLQLNQKFLGGMYIDIPIHSKIIRIIGSKWSGFNAGKSLNSLAKAIPEIPNEADFTIFMFHGGHENYLPTSRGGVSQNDFQCLEGLVNYIALGHIHEHYVIEDSNNKALIFNPGSIEANSMAEVSIARGGLVIQVTDNKQIDYELLSEYKQRAFFQIKNIDASKFSSYTELIEFILKNLINVRGNETTDKPIVQIEITGQITEQSTKISEVIDILRISLEEAGVLYSQIKWNNEDQKVRQDIKINKQDNHANKERLILESIIQNDLSIDKSEQFTELMLNIKELILKGTEDKELLALLDE